jgi:hypothetical protein
LDLDILVMVDLGPDFDLVLDLVLMYKQL